jgi:hypothetical protein
MACVRSTALACKLRAFASTLMSHRVCACCGHAVPRSALPLLLLPLLATLPTDASNFLLLLLLIVPAMLAAVLAAVVVY